ncbi:MAG: GNAT family N-acetyltransferase [Rhizobiaceae bacterium]|nr:GNAT family N-acetyltransferase [Rhizobiaceae bacterium]MCV0408039.1 GNAT family N-acetyltransferase [Rhizobiaceae bacterium]
MIAVRRLSSAEIRRYRDDLAALRIEVFRDWPYLYDGDLDYERRYLETYLQASGAVVIGAFDGANLVGAATAAPLVEHEEAFAAPLAAAGFDPGSIFYFGESVLRARYRGQGIGVAFFEQRERAAREAGYATCLFSAVVRPTDHSARPKDHVPLDGFWTKRGYSRLEGATTRYAWRDVGDTVETDKPMEYWIRHLPEIGRHC